MIRTARVPRKAPAHRAVNRPTTLSEISGTRRARTNTFRKRAPQKLLRLVTFCPLTPVPPAAQSLRVSSCFSHFERSEFALCRARYSMVSHRASGFPFAFALHLLIKTLPRLVAQPAALDISSTSAVLLYISRDSSVGAPSRKVSSRRAPETSRPTIVCRSKRRRLRQPTQVPAGTPPLPPSWPACPIRRSAFSIENVPMRWR